MSSGYLSRKKSKGKIYLYLRRSYREEGNVKHQYLHSFGPLPNALEVLYSLRENPENFPISLEEQGFTLIDLQEWILTVETRVTSTGRDFGW